MMEVDDAQIILHRMISSSLTSDDDSGGGVEKVKAGILMINEAFAKKKTGLYV